MGGINKTADGVTSQAVDAELAKVTKVQVKACFSKHSTKDRKWRKTKDEIGKDKQCFKKLIEEVHYPAPGSTTAQVDEYTWTIADTIPKATYFFRVFAYDAEGNGIGYWKVKGYDGLTSGVVTGVVILSITSWVLLISYFVYEHYIQKDD